MARKTKTKKAVALKSPVDIVNNELQGEFDNLVRNGLGEALLGSDFDQFSQLSQTDTLFKNNRWYLISNFRQLISQIYVEHGLVRTVVDVPVEDALRGGIEIQSQQLSPEQVEDLQNIIEKESDMSHVSEAAKWTRLFGGGGVVIITDQDPSTPLNLSAINEKTPLTFRGVDMWELFWSKQNTNDTAASIAEEDLDVEYYDYYGVKLHKSRVLRMNGLRAPSFIRPRLRGWGFSVLESLVRSINQYLKATDLSFDVLDEFKLDIYKIKGLTNSLLQKDGAKRISERVKIANAQKNYQNAITMDAEDDYVQKQLTFAGIGEAMTGIRMQIASDLRMPLTKIFGISSAGFSSGEDDIENYNAMVESEVRGKLKYHIYSVLEIRCQKLFGFVPDDLKFEFKPLRVLSSEQEENVKTQRFNRLLQAKQAGEITSAEFRHGINKANLLPIQLDTSKNSLKLAAKEKAEESEGDTVPSKEEKSITTAKQAPEAKV